MVWGRRPGGFSKRILLVLDAFWCHRFPALLRLLKEEYMTTWTIIPGDTPTDEEDATEVFYYKETPTRMTNEEMRKFFDSDNDTDDEDFEGFDASDINRRPL
ncbi:hypothetical protein DPMN_010102 [Dreissena polymorpha]|uniref:Uncharacterized protein n=1 Tax=Dreissena polymorpha TaxID=45954 RepID=A0A9D4N0W6_DREPO|nr:hypothetical protein DPMN_010102 [Dreissena polymorpha]